MMLETEAGSKCGPVIVNRPEAMASLEYHEVLTAYSPADTLNYTGTT